MGSACSLETMRQDRSESEHLRHATNLQFHFDVKPRSDLAPKDLCHAALRGDVRKASWVLEQHEPHKAGSSGWTPLHLSAAGGHQDVARMLLKQRAEVDPEGLSVSPLSLACLLGKASTVELLICSLAKLDGPDQNGGAPLLHAAYKNRTPICQLLLDSGANPQDVFARTSLCFAAQRGHREATVALLEHRAHTETADWIGHTAASWAAKMGQKHIVELLLDVIPADFVPWFGAPTMLHVAAYHRRMGVAACLLAQHGNPEVRLQPGDLRPLMVAAFQGSVEICQLLLSHHAAVNQKDETGTTAWQYAAMSGHEKTCDLLVAFGASES